MDLRLLPELASELGVEPQQNREGMENFRAPHPYDAHKIDHSLMRRLADSLINHGVNIGTDSGHIDIDRQSREAGFTKPEPAAAGFEHQTEEDIPELVDSDDEQDTYDKKKLKSDIEAATRLHRDNRPLDPFAVLGIDTSRDDMSFDMHYSGTEDDSSGDESDGFVSICNTVEVKFEVRPAANSNVLYATIACTRGLDVIHIVDLKERTIKFITARRSIENTIIGDASRRGLIIGMSSMALPGRYEWAMGCVVDDGQKSGVWKCVWPALEHQLPEAMREQTVDIHVEEDDYSVKDWDWDIRSNTIPPVKDDEDQEMNI